VAQAAARTHVWDYRNCAIIVAHPDDETLWAGGTILLHPESRWTVVALARKSDSDRAPRFFRALEMLGAAGAIGDLDDGPDQNPLDRADVQEAILDLLPLARFDLVITHGPWGEYTRHLRHEETGNTVMTLWNSDKLTAREIWRFAYEDGGGKYLPRPVPDADIRVTLTDGIWQKKYDIITDIYGFSPDSFEARTTPRGEAFWCFHRAVRHD
jgi:LmbE family N-acetylglucosaminyl deacetylase